MYVGYLYDCTFRGTEAQFKCTMEGELDYELGFCQQISEDHDGFAACPDKSDERE